MREATNEEVARATAIVKETSYLPNQIEWNGNKGEAFALANAVANYRPTSKGCFACNVKCLNILREIAGIPPIGGESSESLRTRRLNICKGDEANDPCEHLSWPGLNCGKCGCFVDIKASFKRFRCPINTWPIA
jgi:hypothetical protein